MSDEIKLADVRPEVAAFAVAMERKLRANDHKGGWKGEAPHHMVARICDETAELIASLHHDGRARDANGKTEART